MRWRGDDPHRGGRNGDDSLPLNPQTGSAPMCFWHGAALTSSWRRSRLYERPNKLLATRGVAGPAQA